MSNMSKKIISSVFIVLFVGIFSYFNGWEYIDFYQDNQSLQEQNLSLENEINSFSLDKVRELDSISFHANPNKEFLDELVWIIDLAEQRVYLEVYMFTEKRIRAAIKKANERWLDVKVLLEKNPYMAPTMNRAAFEELEKAWVDVAWSNPKNYSLNHSKFMVVDDKVVISTWNYSYSTFAYNRDFFLVIEDKLFLEDILSIFLNDFAWNKVSFYNHNLVLSPDYSRKKLEALISNAKESLVIYFPYTTDERLEDLLFQKVKEWIDVSMIVSSEVLDDEEEKKLFEKFWGNGIKIKAIKKPKIHSKSILTDSKYLYIWSINFSSYSIDKNREIWLIIKNEDVIEEFLNVFWGDFNE